MTWRKINGIEQRKNLVGRRQQKRDDKQLPVLFGVSIKKVHGLRVAPILPSNLDGRKRLAIQESDAANHAIKDWSALADDFRTLVLRQPVVPLVTGAVGKG